MDARPRNQAWAAAALAALLVPLAPASAQGRRAKEPLDLALRDFRRTVDAALKPDTTRFGELRKGAPRALVRFRGDIHRFPPIPPMTPGPEELGNTYPLAALPPSWIPALNDIGRQLFQQGLEDGRSGQIAPQWKPLRDELEAVEVPRIDIPSLGEVAENYSPKTPYEKLQVPFGQLEAARAQVEAALQEVPGGRRSSILTIPDDHPAGDALLVAFRQHEDAAREVAGALRNKIEGVVMRNLVRLQAEVNGVLEQKLGRAPEVKDVGRFGQLMPTDWRRLIRWNHARHYYEGYRAVANRMAGGGTGDGSSGSQMEIPGGGTGDGTSGGGFQGSGTGDGAGEATSITGGGTGDGTAAVDPSRGTGTGDGR